MINTVLLLVITVLLTILLLQHRRTGAEFQVGGDFTGAGPTIGTKIVKFESDMSFAPMEPREFFSNETLARWNTLMPVGTGWGSVNETFFTTSMTHQLHCVFMMGRIFNGLMLNVTDNLPSDWHFHFLHCIDYLRQAIMCSGDVAMEAHEPDETDDTGPLDGGWNAHHVCKDYGQVIKYLERQIKDGVRVVLPIDD
ncbi:hypothetical protein QBC46DRAFT_389930 [Diplogelasinospora grovesii]|uniref:Oxidase ustYa n=1 Tax=Diplogelasinospora grovesii TaxID=303347 RepID=A0AAN6N3L6_9PEZI|nr:hypothetical protein QBC46DRAFT_389930 [Diplogelasinospora grovesii]